MNRILQAGFKQHAAENVLIQSRTHRAGDPAFKAAVADVVARVSKIADVRKDKRIDFVGGARGVAELERQVNSGKAAVAFSLYPVAVADLMAVSDAGAIMPPKSTWFEPKLRDGLLINEI